MNGTGNPPLTGGNVDTAPVTVTLTTPEITVNASINGTGNPPLTGGNVTGCSDPTILCCQGTNSTCRRGCFCDQACLIFRDCCLDYKQTCTQHTKKVVFDLQVCRQSTANGQVTQESLQNHSCTISTIIC
ncbi:hypothetical protein NFI96_001722 [Prochilodus magdalenae]|nr:hypothetical protein NFI96_001722 [Prochilodus magdalenae]